MWLNILSFALEMSNAKAGSSTNAILSFFSSFSVSTVHLKSFLSIALIWFLKKGNIFSIDFSKNLPHATTLLFNTLTYLIVFSDHNCIIESMFLGFTLIRSLFIIYPKTLSSSAPNMHLSGLVSYAFYSNPHALWLFHHA